MTGRNLLKELEEAEARAALLRREIAAGPCKDFGHDWYFHGGRNAGCGEGCNCSVPVYSCRKCGDCDYGDNPEAAEIVLACEGDNA